MADESLPGGAYEAADKAWSSWPGVTDSERDELEAALLAAAPFIAAAERERLAVLAEKSGAVYDPDGSGVAEPFASVIRETT